MEENQQQDARWLIQDDVTVVSSSVNGSSSSSNLNEDEDTVALINYVAYRIVANVIVAVGIVGNLINLIVLTRPKLKGVMYRYLLGLAASNLLVLVTAIPALAHISGAVTGSGGPNFELVFFQAHLEIPLLNGFMASSVYIIICMTVNRYISIYRPTQFQRIHTFKNAYIAIALSFIGGALLHVPLAFETNVVAECYDDNSSNSSSNSSSTDNCVYHVVTNDKVASHPLYRVYLWVSESLLRLGPIVTLTILNILIIVRFRKIAMKREVLKGGQQHRGSNASNTAAAATTTAAAAASSSSNSNNNGCNRTMSITANGRLSVPKVTVDATTSGFQCDSGVVMTESTFASSSVIVTAPSPSPTPTPTQQQQPSPQQISPTLSPTRHHLQLVMRRGGPSRASSRRSRRGLHNPEERMLVVVLIAVVVLFVVCTTPAAFLSVLVTDELKAKPWFAVFRACANNLELLCFALNFFVYCLCSADIRRAFVDVLFENPVVTYLRRKSITALNGNNNVEMSTVKNNGVQNV